ncbi:MMPL family transporter [Aestuariimicrobium soli]|uniref:MMPL family transporter n=1 Tax=Aestuariimicrobium soli TaxID=2035834 RepID=UPI003EBD03A6
MSTVLYDLARWCFRHRRRVLVLWLAALVLLGGLAALVAKPYNDDFNIPGAPSQEALTQLKATFPQAASLTATAIVVVPVGSSVNDPEIKAAVEKIAKGYEANPKIDSVTTPYNELVTGLISKDERAGLLQLNLKGSIDEVTDAERADLQNLTTKLQADLPAGSQLSLGGEAFSIEVPALSVVEAVGVVVAMVVLLVTLGSLVAAGLPLLTALLGVGFGMLMITLATALASINSTTPMLAVMLGLAVGIDYALFIVSRHRDQLRGAPAHEGDDPRPGMDVEESVARSVATAGSAVVFAGLTVVIALVGLAIANIPFLTVMGAFAAVTVVFGVLIALTLLPALLGFAGERLRPKAAKPRKNAKAAAKPGREGGIFGWWVRVVTKVPVLTVVLVVVGLGALSYPATNLWHALPNPGQHAPSQPDRVTYDLISDHFGPGANGPLIITVDLLPTTDPLKVMADIKADVEAMPGVSSVPIATPNQNADTGFVQVVPTTGPDDPRTGDLVNAIRAHHDEWKADQGVETNVTGSTAIQLDIADRLGKALLPFGVFVVGLSLVLLTMVFRSIAVPLKATIGYALSVGAAFGATTLVFNEGIGRQLINLDKPGPVISFLPIIVMGILFGLAMDYEVFLVSRMREDHVHGTPAREAVHSGFIASGKVVSAAAVIMFAVFAFFVPEGMGPIKQIGFALAVGVAVDAFLVRMTLVPAVLALLGEKAWWLPGWLDRLLPSFDVEGEALSRQVALTDWPTPPRADGTRDEVLHVEGFGVDQLVDPVDARLLPGQVGIVVGPPRSRSALLLALAGRLPADVGRGRVAGELLPDQAGKVRRSVRWIDALNGEVRPALERVEERLVVIDGVDSLTKDADLAAVRDLMARARETGEFGVVLGVADSEQARHWPADGVVEVTVPHPRDDQPDDDEPFSDEPFIDEPFIDEPISDERPSDQHLQQGELR